MHDQPGKFSIRFAVSDLESGRGVSRAVVRVRSDDDTDRVTTDNGGRGEFAGLAEGKYYVKVVSLPTPNMRTLSIDYEIVINSEGRVFLPGEEVRTLNISCYQVNTYLGRH
ncbi:hypothetical protein FACS18948_1540 [Clostridia bacterium]|nr:hypothetical protein FACS18948_1540 [Clostridia bacterium]